MALAGPGENSHPFFCSSPTISTPTAVAPGPEKMRNRALTAIFAVSLFKFLFLPLASSLPTSAENGRRSSPRNHFLEGALTARDCTGGGSVCKERDTEPNPPMWPDSVTVFTPDDKPDEIEVKVNAAFAVNGGHSPPNNGQFSPHRFAFLFQPGEYNVSVPVGYYTQVCGLGPDTPSQVTFTSSRGVYAEEGDYSIGGGLSTFWRAAENFRTKASYPWAVGRGMTWAVSQAAPLRRIQVDNDLLLFEYQPPIIPAGETSGGFSANLHVDGAVRSGSQQQWFIRDSTVGSWVGGVWNMVFVGVDGAPSDHCGNSTAGGSPFTTVERTPVVSEKPFVAFEAETGKYQLVIPPVKFNSRGVDFAAGEGAGMAGGQPVRVDFSNVYVTKPTDKAEDINARLSLGLHVVVSPGVYHLDSPLVLNTTGQVLLGLGLATLVSANQTPVITVGDVDGVRVAGVLVQAGPAANGQDTSPDHATKSHAISPTLIEWGSSEGHEGDPQHPSFLHDVFARVGGPDGTDQSPVAAEKMIHVRSGNVVGDNLWLWRADHALGGPVTYTSNRCDNGLVVDGNDVVMYGLAVEHTLQDLTVWNGERGRTYFYQSELPYLVSQEQFGDKGFVGYRVGEDVKTHGGWGIGVYCFFRDHNVTVESAIKAPSHLENGAFIHPMTVFLNGQGGISHILNDKGEASSATNKLAHYLCRS